MGISSKDENYKTWLTGLKPGDQVVVNGGMRHNRYTFHKVAKITPTGRINLDNGQVFKSNGHALKDPGKWSFRDVLLEPTQEIRDKLRKERLAFELSHYKFEALSLDQLERIKAIVREGSET